MRPKPKRKLTATAATGDELHPPRDGKRFRAISRPNSAMPPETSATGPSGSNSPTQSLQVTRNLPAPADTLTSTAWTGLEQALQGLRLTTKICPPLCAAIDDLVSCVPLFEVS
ncbi:hypothetical protein B0J17DRAFT_680392 [Rhizoctonia solani]|nr:hypothetical protein B0J17DRAFT_680392 [Rhizoctonia solani]